MEFVDEAAPLDELAGVADGGELARGDDVEAAHDLEEQLPAARVAGGQVERAAAAG